MRDLDLSTRAESTRPVQPRAVQFDLRQIKAHFDISLESIEKQYRVSDELIIHEQVDEGKNILRSQLVFVEGILDFYIHEVSKYALFQMFAGNWRHSERYNNFQVTMKQVEEAIQSSERKDWFFDYLNDRFCRDVFLGAETMKDQLNLIGIPFNDVMAIAFPMTTVNESAKEGRRVVQSLFDRRNAIAHQLDRSHESAKQSDITKEYVEECVSNVKKIADAIYQVAVEKG